MHTVLTDHNPAVVKSSLKPSDKSLYAGYALLGLSLLIFIFAEIWPARQNAFNLFFVHYVIAAAYIIYLLTIRSYGIFKSWRRPQLPKTIVLLQLLLVAAFALNRELNVFEDSTTWLCVFIVVTSANMLLYGHRDKLPRQVRRIHNLATGVCLVFYLYFTFYMFPFYGYGILGTIVLGIGALVFVPASFLLATILLIRYEVKRFHDRLWVAAGVALTVLITTAFVVEWCYRIEKMEHVANNSVLTPDDLPQWIRVAQRLSNDWITIRALKSDLVYTTWNRLHGQRFFSPPGFWDQQRKHDPLVFIASAFLEPRLGHDERINVLKSHFASRHLAEERLWSGEDLVTSSVISDIDIYPALRLAYTEKYLTIRNTKQGVGNFGSSQEAIYTFHLPEGSVVTSLSLWVNGVEEKAFLTSKQKATEAYQTIVGREVRDPSVVHWREGNTVSVRVFPCTPDEDRRFKIGITSPIPVEKGKAVFRNVTFEGPSATETPETFRVTVIGGEIRNAPKGFSRNAGGQFIRESNYDPDFQFSFPLLPLPQNQFSFNGFQYTLRENVPESVPLQPKGVFIDLNSSWTEGDVERIKPLIRQHAVYVFEDGIRIKLSDENWTDVTARLRAHNFSLFPFHKSGANALVVTKGVDPAPRVHDLKQTEFLDRISTFFSGNPEVFVYNIGTGNAAYINTLRELRVLRYAQGGFDGLFQALTSGRFPVFAENENQIYLHDCGLYVTKKAGENHAVNGKAPDHLARLFAYNNIMRKAGPRYFAKDMISDDLVAEATEAYVVTPVSSLIVLETKEDYERFGIHQSSVSLLNAKKDNSGAVPEPHEWALIGLFALVVAFTFRHRLKPMVSI